MTTETIELIKILRDVTQSRAVYDRCGAELGKLGAAVACVAHNKTIADEVFDCALGDNIDRTMAVQYSEMEYWRRALKDVLSIPVLTEVDRTLPAKSETPS